MKPSSPRNPRSLFVATALWWFAASFTVAFAATAPKDGKGDQKRPPGGKKLQQQLADTKDELEHTRVSLHEAHKELANKAEAISTLQSQVDSLSKQLAEARGNLKKLTGAAGDLVEEKKKNASLQESLRDLQKKAGEALVRAEAESRRQAEAANEALNKQAREIEALRQELVAVQKGAATALTAAEKQARELANESRQALAEKHAAVDQLKTELEKVRQQAAEAIARAEKDALAEAVEAKKAIAAKAAEVEGVRAKLQEVEKAAAEALARAEQEARKQQAISEETAAKAAREVASLKEQLEQAENDAARALAEAEANAREMATKSAAEIRRKTLEVAALQNVLQRVQSQTAAALEASKRNMAAANQRPAPAKPKTPKIDPLLYPINSAAPPKEWNRVAREVKNALKQFPKATVVLCGHADDSRYAETNHDISENRARFLCDYLATADIPRDRIEIKGLGNSRPVKGNPEANRRVDIEIRP
ncbi:MAG: OmpA family protein [Verrucomicrobiae bacterium]|nr:OmpA family protein [Verrucomicrobiae bacterium]